MKKRLLLTLLGGSLLFTLHAESKMSKEKPKMSKVGHVSLNYILSFLPESQKVSSVYEQFQEKVGKESEEYQNKLKAFRQGKSAMTAEVRKQKEEELENIRSRIEKYKEEAEESFTKQQLELIPPLLEKVKATIAAVAKEKGYTDVISSDMGPIPILLYTTEETDISNLVLGKLGITPQSQANKAKNNK